MNYQLNDLEIYDTHAEAWWDGSVRWLRILHNMVPARLAYFDKYVNDWSEKRVIDIGCGGGFMTEALAKRSAEVFGIDPSKPAINAARNHAASLNLTINYKLGQAEYIDFDDNSFDIVVCVDVLEHVENLEKSIKQISRILKPNGLFFFDTINRNWLSKFLVITLAERIIKILPCGAHNSNMFIKPSELRKILIEMDLHSINFSGIGPVSLNRNLDLKFGEIPLTLVQYMGVARKNYES